MSQDRWQDVKAKVEGLGLKLKLHLEQEDEAATEEGTATTGQAQAAIEEMGAKLHDAVNSLGNAAKDPAIRADLRDLGELLRDAMNETFSTVSTEVGDILKKTKGQMAAEQEDAASTTSAGEQAGVSAESVESAADDVDVEVDVSEEE